MKKLLLLSITAIGLLLLFGVSCHKDGPTPQQLDQQHQDSITALFNSSVGYHLWQINSQTISPPQNGSNVLAIDSCTKYITYVFGALQRTPINQEGTMKLDYHGTSCGNGIRPNPSLIFYYLDVNPNTIQFPGDGHDLNHITYKILKATPDSLVLQHISGSSVIVSTYLALK